MSKLLKDITQFVRNFRGSNYVSNSIPDDINSNQVNSQSKAFANLEKRQSVAGICSE